MGHRQRQIEAGQIQIGVSKAITIYHLDSRSLTLAFGNLNSAVCVSLLQAAGLGTRRTNGHLSLAGSSSPIELRALSVSVCVCVCVCVCGQARSWLASAACV